MSCIEVVMICLYLIFSTPNHQTYLLKITIELYEMLERVDKTGADLQFVDPICDFLYPYSINGIGLSIAALGRAQ